MMLVSLLFITSCKPGPGATQIPLPGHATATRQPEELTAVTNTPFAPSPTPLPLAARVNGQEITLASYQAELARYAAALGHEPSLEEQSQVINDLIQQVLLSQAAVQNGFVADDTILNSRLDELKERLGGQEALAQWLSKNGYLESEFREDLRRSIQAAWMRDQIIASVPLNTEQVRARQILLADADQANDILSRLQSGANFERLASQNDPLTGGELGWFPRGYLFYPELEEAIFALQPGQYTPVIQTPLGFHIVQVFERDPQRRLSPDALLQAQKLALQAWLENQLGLAEIELYVGNP